MYWCDPGNFEGHWNIPHSNDRLIRFAKGILIVLLNTFNTFVGILLDPVAFLLFRLLIIS